MLHRFRITWLAVGGALLLVLSMSGLVGAANLVTDGSTQTPLAFIDINGNGVADTCETGATANTVAAAAALAAADLNGDGTISVTEAAQSGWIGGTNCNHGGYVSSVARTSTDTCDTTDQSAGDSQDASGSTENANEDSTENSNEDAADQTTDNSTTTVSTVTTTAVTTTTTAPTCSQTSTDTTAPTTAVCPVVAPVAPVGGAPVVVDTSPNAHGLAVSTVAQSTDVGGKNCNHGGAVSAAAHAAHGLNADKAAKRAAHLLKHQGKGHKH